MVRNKNPTVVRTPPRASTSGIQNSTKRLQPPRTANPGPMNTKQFEKRTVWQDIAELRNTVHRLIPKAPFYRMVKEILMDVHYASTETKRITPTALEALHEASEIYITQLFEHANICTLHRGRVTLNVSDLHLALYLRSFF